MRNLIVVGVTAAVLTLSSVSIAAVSGQGSTNSYKYQANSKVYTVQKVDSVKLQSTATKKSTVGTGVTGVNSMSLGSTRSMVPTAMIGNENGY